ncbi:hypothetical protein BDW22DRAFT_1364195 [Trametopsis cervina]|nr:hypothetical protein BDW22DRAFT_1364195 [Trametopsis cervina]
MTYLRFNALSLELVIYVLEHLDYQDLLNCRQLSHRFKDAIDNHIPFQYQGALRIAGLSDNPNNSLSTFQKLTLLIDHHNSWFSPFSLGAEKRSYPPRNVPVWKLAGNVLAQSRGRDEIEFTQLPTRIRGDVREKTWTTRLQYPHVYFAMDPSQDLLITVQPWSPVDQRVRVCILTMSTGQNHPEAQASVVSLQVWDGHEIHYEIRINGPYFSVLVTESGPQPCLIVWNWKTGAEEYINAGLHFSFIWVSDTCFLIVQLKSAYTLGSVTLLLVNLLDLDSSWTFSLPALAAGASASEIELVGEPAMTWKSSAKLGDDLSPFQTTRDNGLIILRLHMQSDFDVCLTFSFLSSDLLRFAEDRARGMNRFSIFIPWHLWGPQHTRASCLNTWDYTWSCTVSGLKHAFLQTAEGSARLVVRDFNPLHVLWQSHIREHNASQCTALHPLPADARGRVTVVESSHRTDQIFKDYFLGELETSVPYVQWASAWDLQPSDRVMISEDWVVVVKQHESDLEIYPLR